MTHSFSAAASLAVLLVFSCAALVSADDLLFARDLRGNRQSDFFVFKAGQRVDVPYASSLQINSFGNAELLFNRGCEGANPLKFDGLKQFPDLSCRYNKTSFVGCFREDVSTNPSTFVLDPFFVEGQEIFFASSVELSVRAQPHRKGTASLRQSAYVTEPEYCEPSSTIEMIAEMYAQDTLAREWTRFFAYFSPTITMKANVFATVYEGIAVVYAYHLLADPTISDLLDQIGSDKVSVVSSGNVVIANWLLTTIALGFPPGPDPENPLNVYQDNQIQELTFNEYGQIQSIDLYVDTAKLYAYYPNANAPLIPETCAIIQSHCQGAEAQFASEAECVTFMESIELIRGPVVESVGANTVACRAYHTSLSLALPEHHCKHTGPYWDGDIVSYPCNDATSAWNPHPANKRTAVTRSMHSSSACTGDSAYCNYRVVSHVNTMTEQMINMERALLNNIPAAGQIIAQHLGLEH